MKKLIIGKLPADFNETEHILFNTYSLKSGDINFEKYEIFSFLERSETDFEYLDLETSKLVKEYISDNVDRFNERFKIKRSYVFYKTVFYPWLILLVQTYTERLLQLKKFQNLYQHKVVVELVDNNLDLGFQETRDIHNAINEVEFNEWLTSMVIRNTPNNFKLIDSKRRFFFQHKAETDNILMKAYKKMKFRFLRAQKVYGFNFFDFFIASIYLFFKTKPNKSKQIEFFDNTKTNDDSLLSLLPIEQIFNLTMPNSIKNIINLPRKIKKSNRSKFILGSHIIRANDMYRIRVADALEKGDKVIGFQHGGGSYGFAKHCEEIYENELSQYNFITWGWQKHRRYNAKFIRLPSPYLTNFKDIYNKKSESLIFVTTKMNNVNRYLNPSPTQLEWHQKIKDQYSLLEGLINDNHKVIYRPHPNKEGSIAGEEYILNRIKDLNVYRGNLHHELFKSKCLILDHPGTTLNLAMVSNVPTFLFWKKQHYLFDKNTQEFFDKFKLLNIFHEDTEQLIAFLRETDLETWWASKDVQKVRSEFNNEFCYSNNNWRKEWSNYFMHL